MEPINKKGVTLVELIVVFVIIAVLAVLMVPNIGAWLPNYRLRSATRDVVSILRTAQTRAVSTNTPYGVGFSAGGCQLYRSSGGFTAEGAAINLPSGVQFTNNTFPVNGSLPTPQPYAQFNTDSTSPGAGGSVTLQGRRGTRRVTVAPATGRIRSD